MAFVLITMILYLWRVHGPGIACVLCGSGFSRAATHSQQFLLPANNTTCQELRAELVMELVLEVVVAAQQLESLRLSKLVKRYRVQNPIEPWLNVALQVDVTPSFDSMGLKEDLIRGIYAYGAAVGIVMVVVDCCIQALRDPRLFSNGPLSQSHPNGTSLPSTHVYRWQQLLTRIPELSPVRERPPHSPSLLCNQLMSRHGELSDVCCLPSVPSLHRTDTIY